MLKELFQDIWAKGMASAGHHFSKDDQERAVLVGPAGVTKWADPSFPAIKLQTLTGLVDYVKANKDSLELKDVMVHVDAHDRVTLRGIVEGDWLQRDSYLVAGYDAPQQFPFGGYMDVEQFIIEAQAKFMDSECRPRLLALVGNLMSGSTATAADDGVTQSVTMKAGVTMKSKGEVQNPFTLQPFRTFHEVMQPDSPYILRVKAREGALPQVALFEADGGAWKNDAICTVARYLKRELPEGLVVIA